MPPKRVIKTLDIQVKYKLIKEVQAGARKKDIAVKYGIPPNTLSTILKESESIIKAVEDHGCRNKNRLKKATYEKIDEAVLDWFKAAKTQNLPVSGTKIRQKALEFANQLGETRKFKASTGWLDKWRKRYGIFQKKMCGESTAIDEGEDFNADETALFFKCLPDKTLTFKEEECNGGKLDDEFPTDETILGRHLPEVVLQEEAELSEPEVAAPSKETVESALNTVRLYLNTNEHTAKDIYSALDKIQRFIEQDKNKTLSKTQ